MKRNELLKYLNSYGCYQLREGSRHSWWFNPEQNRRSSVPRHVEISNNLCIKICKDLGIPPIR
ncbi:MAG: type II toxin-antitoxin system HicA family toxin [Bacteroidetes bacterium]|nr:MAG: type II toxin-antitoxin system HicA family toxin [Bacteroidota bacterium]